jgi:hypothetical protein
MYTIKYTCVHSNRDHSSHESHPSPRFNSKSSEARPLTAPYGSCLFFSNLLHQEAIQAWFGAPSRPQSRVHLMHIAPLTTIVRHCDSYSTYTSICQLIMLLMWTTVSLHSLIQYNMIFTLYCNIRVVFCFFYKFGCLIYKVAQPQKWCQCH